MNIWLQQSCLVWKLSFWLQLSSTVRKLEFLGSTELPFKKFYLWFKVTMLLRNVNFWVNWLHPWKIKSGVQLTPSVTLTFPLGKLSFWVQLTCSVEKKQEIKVWPFIGTIFSSSPLSPKPALFLIYIHLNSGSTYYLFLFIEGVVLISNFRLS